MICNVATVVQGTPPIEWRKIKRRETERMRQKMGRVRGGRTGQAY